MERGGERGGERGRNKGWHELRACWLLRVIEERGGESVFLEVVVVDPLNLRAWQEASCARDMLMRIRHTCMWHANLRRDNRYACARPF